LLDPITRCLGLVVQYNPNNVAPGSLVKADNCLILRENVVEDRRGYAVYATLANSISSLLTYSNRILSHHGTALSFDDGAGTFTDYTGSYSAPSSAKMRFVEAFSNAYVTTSAGVQVLTGLASGSVRKAGAPRSLDPSYSLNAAGSGFLAAGSQCAYRTVIQRTDANSNVLYGYPSPRLWVANAAGTGKNVDLTLYLPAEAIAGDVVQFYRTAQVAGTGSDTAGDEAALVYQVALTASDITAGFITFTDSIDDALRGAALYISPSQEGITQANDRPPVCKDLALYKSLFMMYANTSTKQRLYLTLVGAGGLTGRSITLAGVTYSFAASENAATGTVGVSGSGVAAVAIDETARSLVRVINRYASNTGVYAYYLSGPSDLPGQILIEERGIGAAAFTVQSSDSTISAMFYPPPPVSPSTNTKSTSSNAVQANAIFYSKQQQPEAVPALNYVLVGPANEAILRIAPLRDSLIIIKERGVYRLSGETPQSFVVTPLDLTVHCKAADSVVVLANQVLMLSNQGVVVITDAGVQVISREIEPLLKPLLSLTGLSSYTSACAYESDRLYFLSVPELSTDAAATQTFVYNIITRTWVRHTYAFTSALVDPTTDKLFFSKPSSAIVYRERKDFTSSDYADPEHSITITAISGNYVTFTLSGTSPDIGWGVAQGGTEIPIESFVDLGAGSYRALMDSDVPSSWTTGAATLYPSVGMEIVWNAWSGKSLGALKQVSEVALLADNIAGNNSATGVVPTFKTNLDEDQEEVSISVPGGGWGSGWGEIPWGGTGDMYGYRTYVPRNKQFCHLMNVGVKHKNAREKLSCTGLVLNFNVVSEVIGK